MRCGRIATAQPICTATKITRVTAIAGTVRRISSPAATPRANPNAAYATGVMSRVANSTKPSLMKVTLVPSLSPVAVSIGPDHQVSSRLNRPVVTIAARPTTPSLTASQRPRPTPCVHAIL